MNMNNTQTNTV